MYKSSLVDHDTFQYSIALFVFVSNFNERAPCDKEFYDTFA